MKKKHKNLLFLIINLAIIGWFGMIYLARMNYEFIIYIGVIIFFIGLISVTLRKVDYTFGTLAGLTVWSALHLAGGSISVGDERLYDTILLPLSKTYPILRYDQFVHIWGFGVSTLVIFSLLPPLIRKYVTRNPVVMGIVLIMGGLGLGAFNEILEFLVTIFVPETGVGDYINTALDLCSDLIGAIIGLIYIRFRYAQRNNHDSG